MKVIDSFSLDGKIALLTGGASGYGLQIARALAEARATTVIASRKLEALERTASDLRAEGYSVEAMRLDLADEQSILALRDELAARHGHIDVLVNNAVARVMSRGWDDEASRFDESMHINATGLFVITRAVGELMVRQGSGSIINIGSMMGMVGVEHHNYDGTEMSGWAPDYFFHKGGMINFTRFCASYFGRYQVRVNCLSPGGLLSESHPQRFIENYSQRTQLGRLGNEEDLKGAVVFLASDASRYITGTNIPVDGGYTAK